MESVTATACIQRNIRVMLVKYLSFAPQTLKNVCIAKPKYKGVAIAYETKADSSSVCGGSKQAGVAEA